jgi:hypothetical protein
MSSGGPNGSTLTGLNGMVIRDASDITTMRKLRHVYTTNAPLASGYVGVNSYRSKGIKNSYSFVLEVQKGLRECGINVAGTFVPVAGTALSLTPGTTKNLANTSVTIPNTIPTPN